MYHIFFIHSSVDGHLGYCLVLAIANSAAVNIGVHVSFCLFKMFTFNIISRKHNKVINLTESNPQRNPHNTEYMPDSGIAGSYSSSRFGFSRNLRAVLYSGCINLYSHYIQFILYMEIPHIINDLNLFLCYNCLIGILLLSFSFYFLVLINIIRTKRTREKAEKSK